MKLEALRQEFHKAVFDDILMIDEAGVPNNADASSNISVRLAKGIAAQIGIKTMSCEQRRDQSPGQSFTDVTKDFLSKAFLSLSHQHHGSLALYARESIARFEGYEHLRALYKSARRQRHLEVILGDYLIKPDIVIGRMPIVDETINNDEQLTSDDNAALTPVRATNSSKLLLHASISCKWTLRSDRSQNARTEGLNLIRNRKGHTPHIVIVTAEPYPARIASVALGTGDIDCVYHFALRELMATIRQMDNEAVQDSIETLVEGKRLRDISDLPFDLLA